MSMKRLTYGMVLPVVQMDAYFNASSVGMLGSVGAEWYEVFQSFIKNFGWTERKQEPCKRETQSWKISE